MNIMYDVTCNALYLVVNLCSYKQNVGKKNKQKNNM